MSCVPDQFLRVRSPMQKGKVRGNGEFNVVHPKKTALTCGLREQSVDKPRRRLRLRIKSGTEQPEPPALAVLHPEVVARRAGVLPPAALDALGSVSGNDVMQGAP